MIADNLSKAGWNCGCVSAVNFHGRTIWIADAHRDGKRFVVRSDEKLTALLELESAIQDSRARALSFCLLLDEQSCFLRGRRQIFLYRESFLRKSPLRTRRYSNFS